MELEDFEIGAKIGAGTFGIIRRAIEKKTQKEFVLKMIDKTLIQSLEHANHIVREKNILMYLSKPQNTNQFIVQA